MPQISKVETGRPLPRGNFMLSGNASYSIEKPEVLHISDSNIETRTDILGNELTIVTSSDVYSYESRIMVTGEGLYAFNDVFSAGISVDASLGEVENGPSSQCSKLNNKIIEGGLLLRFSKQYGRIGVGFRPELSIVYLYGNYYWLESNDGKIMSSGTKELNYNTLSIKCSSILRYNIINSLSPYLGLHFRSQPYLNNEEHINHEVTYGIYSGIDIHNRYIAISPFFVIPLGSTVNGYHSPMSAGVQCSIILNSSEKN